MVGAPVQFHLVDFSYRIVGRDGDYAPRWRFRIRASAILAGRDPIFMGVSGGLPRRSSTTNAKMPRREGTPHNALIVRHVVEQAIGAKLSGELLDGQRRQKILRLWPRQARLGQQLPALTLASKLYVRARLIHPQLQRR
jgi:hypothetical protein